MGKAQHDAWARRNNVNHTRTTATYTTYNRNETDANPPATNTPPVENTIQLTPKLETTVRLNVTHVKDVSRGVAHTDTAYTVGGREERATHVALLHGGEAEGL